LKLIDFGLSKCFAEGEVMTLTVGSPHFMVNTDCFISSF
jgi:hypothetical protein